MTLNTKSAQIRKKGEISLPSPAQSLEESLNKIAAGQAVLSLGARGESVSWLKEQLNSWKSSSLASTNPKKQAKFKPLDTTDLVFDRETKNLLEEFQRCHGVTRSGELVKSGLEDDGILGRQTIRAMQLRNGLTTEPRTDASTVNLPARIQKNPSAILPAPPNLQPTPNLEGSLDKIRRGETSLALGATGDAVTWLKGELNRWKHSTLEQLAPEKRAQFKPLDAEEGTFDKETKQLLQEFQACHGVGKAGELITATKKPFLKTGVFGMETIRALELKNGQSTLTVEDYKKAVANKQYQEMYKKLAKAPYGWLSSYTQKGDSPLPDPSPETLVKQFKPLIVDTPGGQPEKVSKESHFNQPLANEGLRGNSRKFGDATPEVQAQTLHNIAKHLGAEGFCTQDIAFGLGISRVEGGNNPDAANGKSSASGPVQFIDSTRASLAARLNVPANHDSFDTDINSKLFAEHLKEKLAFVEKELGYGKKGKNGHRQFASAEQERTFYHTAYTYHLEGPDWFEANREAISRYVARELGYGEKTKKGSWQFANKDQEQTFTQTVNRYQSLGPKWFENAKPEIGAGITTPPIQTDVDNITKQMAFLKTPAFKR